MSPSLGMSNSHEIRLESGFFSWKWVLHSKLSLDTYWFDTQIELFVIVKALLFMVADIYKSTQNGILDFHLCGPRALLCVLFQVLLLNQNNFLRRFYERLQYQKVRQPACQNKDT